MSNHINRLKEITNPGSNINPDTAQEFISIMEDKYPNGEWKNAPVEVQASISAFEGHLNSFIYEPWAQDKLNQFHEFKNARGVLAGTLTPLATAPLVVATPIASNTYPRIDNPKFSSAIKKLQQALVDEDHAPNEVNPVNGIAGDTTYMATLSYISHHPKEFQRMLGRLSGQKVVTDGKPSPENFAVLKSYTGMEINESMLPIVIVDNAVKKQVSETTKLKSKTTKELVTELTSLGDNAVDQERRNIVLIVLTKKLQQEGILIYHDPSSNRWTLKNNDGSACTSYDLSQSDMQIAALIGTLSHGIKLDNKNQAGHIVAIFDSTVAEFKLVNPKTKREWVYNDMLSDTSGYAGNKQDNRTVFVSQVDTQIQKLQSANSDPKIQDHIKRGNHVQLQRLEILKAKITNKDSLDPSIEQRALTVVGLREIQEGYYDSQGNPKGDVMADLANGKILDKIVGSGILPVAMVFGLASIFFSVPKWLKYPSYAILLAAVLKGPLKNIMAEYGGDKWLEAQMKGGTSYSPNRATSGTTSTPGEIEQWWRKISGVEDQFKYGYAIIYREHAKHNNGEGKDTFLVEELETIFSLSAGHPGFTSMLATDLEANKDNIDKVFPADVKAAALAEGISESEMLDYIKFLLKARKPGDKTVGDVLSEGRYDVTKKVVDPYVIGETAFNKSIRDNVERLSRYNEKAGKGTHERVETAIAVTLPNIFNYQNADKQDLDRVIADLKAIRADTDLAGTPDVAIIGAIIAEYETVKTKVTAAAAVNVWNDKADGITNTFATETLSEVYNGVSDGIAWLTGVPISLLGKIERITPDEVDRMIVEGEALLAKHSTDPELAKRIKEELSELNERQTILLASLALREQSPALRAKIETRAKKSLRASIVADPERYEKRVEELAADIAVLKEPQANAEGYYEILRQNTSPIEELNSIVSAGDIRGAAKKVLEDVVGAYKVNVEAYALEVSRGASSRLGRLTADLAFPTNSSAERLGVLSQEYSSLRAELLVEGNMMKARKFIYDSGITINGQDKEYSDLLADIQGSLARIGVPTKLYSSDIKTDLDRIETELNERGATIAKSINTSSLELKTAPIPTGILTATTTKAFVLSVTTIQKDTIASLPSGREKDRAQLNLNNHVSTYIARLSDQARTAGSNDELDEVLSMYEELDGIERGEDTFKDTVAEVKGKEIFNISMGEAPQGIMPPLEKLVKTMDAQKIPTNTLWALIQNPDTKMGEILSVINAEIKVQEKMLKTNPSDKEQLKLLNELKGSRGALILVLEENWGVIGMQWAKKHGVNFIDYLYSLNRA